MGGIDIVLVLLEPPSGGPIWGALCAPPGAPRAGGPPGGQKSAHFFGYLITLPVGTVWGLFFGPRDTPGLGQFGGYPWYHLRWAVFIHQLCCYGWAGALGRRASDGYPLAGLTANGWYVPSGRGPPSRQGRKSAQDREVAGRRRPFARAKRGPTTGVTGKVRKCLAEQVVPYQQSWSCTQSRPSGPQPLGTDGRQAGRGTHRRRRLTHPTSPLLAPAAAASNY